MRKHKPYCKELLLILKKRVTISILKSLVIYFGIFIFQISSTSAQCIEPKLPVIMGPISECDALDNSHCNYYVSNSSTLGTYSWSCQGCLFNSSSGSTADVNWVGSSGPYSITVTHTYNDETCQSTIFLNDCDCKPTILFDNVIINLNERNFSDLASIAHAIDSVKATVQSNGPYPDYILVRGATLFIRGEFNLNSAQVDFSGCTLYMDKGSVIYTPQQVIDIGLKFENTTIQGICDNMWQGIRVGLEGHLEMIDNSSLSDAEFGIQINGKMHLDLVNSNFFRNYVTIYGAPSTGNEIGDNIENCNFDGSQDLVSGRYHLQNYTGQFPTNGQHPLPQGN